MKKWILALIILCILLFISILFLHFSFCQRLIVTKISGYIEKKYEFKISYKSVNYNLINLKIQLKDIKLFYKNKKLLTLEEGEIQPYYSVLWGNYYSYKKVYLKKVIFYLDKEDSYKNLFIPSGLPGKNAPIKFKINKLDITEGKINLKDEVIPLDMQSGDINLRMKRMKDDVHEGSLIASRITINYKEKANLILNLETIFKIMDSNVEINKLKITNKELTVLAAGEIGIFPKLSLLMDGESVINLSILRGFLSNSNENIDGILSSKLRINYKDTLYMVNEFSIRDFAYKKITYPLIRGDFVVEYPEIKINNIGISDGEGELSAWCDYSLRNKVMVLEAKWSKFHLNKIIESFLVPVKERLITDGNLSFKGKVESFLESESMLGVKVYSEKSKGIRSKIVTNWRNDKVDFKELKFEIPGAYFSANKVYLQINKGDVNKSNLSIDANLTISNYSKIMRFIEENFVWQKVLRSMNLLSNISNLAGESKISYYGNLEEIKKAKVESKLLASLRGLDNALINIEVDVRDNVVNIENIELISKREQIIFTKGKVKLNKPFWNRQMKYDLRGQIKGIELNQFAFVNPLINKIKGRLSGDYGIKGTADDYIIKVNYFSNDLLLMGESFKALVGEARIVKSTIYFDNLNINKDGIDASIIGKYNLRDKRMSLDINLGADLSKISIVQDKIRSASLLRSKDIERVVDESKVEGLILLKGSVEGLYDDLNGFFACSGERVSIASVYIGDIKFDVSLKKSVAHFDVSADTMRISGDTNINKSLQTSAAISFTDSAVFDIAKYLVPDLKLELLMTSDLSFNGYLLEPRTYVLEAAIDRFKLTIKERDLIAAKPFSVEYSDKLVLIKNAIIKVGDSFLSVDGVSPFNEEESANMKIKGEIDREAMQLFSSLIKLDGNISIDVQLIGKKDNLSAIGYISSKARSVFLNSYEIEDVDFLISLLDGEIRISGTGKIADGIYEIKGNLMQGDLFRMVRRQTNKVFSDIVLKWQDIRVNKLLNFEDLDIDTAGEIRIAQLGYQLKDLSVFMDISRLLINADRYELHNEGLIEIALSNGSIRFKRAKFSGLDSEFYIEGDIDVLKENINNFHIEGLATLYLANMLIPRINFDGKVLLGVKARGSINSPLLEGKAEVKLAYLDWRDYSVFASNIELVSRIDNWRIDVEKCVGEINGGDFKCKGFIGLEKILKPIFSIDFESNGFNILYPEGLKATADATLKIGGVYPKIKVSGSVNVLDAIFKKDIYPEAEAMAVYFQKEMIAERASTIAYESILDIDCSLPDYVHFSNNIANMDATGNLRILGSLSNPLLAGNLRIYPGGTISYAQKIFVVKRGEITYSGTNYWNPYLNISLEREEEIISHNWTEKYKIYFEARGEPDNLEVKLYSQPTLQEKEIIKLLAGKTPNEMASNIFAVFTGKYTETIAGTIGRAFHLEKFKIEPLLVSNEANPAARFTFGRSLTKNLFLTYSLSLSNSSNQTWIADYSLFKNLSVRALRRDDGSYNASLRQSWRLGLGLVKKGKAEKMKETDKFIVRDLKFVDSIYSEKLLQEIVKIKRGDNYTFLTVNKSVEELRKFYQRNGYLMTRINVKRAYIENSNMVDIVFDIKTNKKITLTISNLRPEKKLVNKLYEIFNRPYNLKYALEEVEKIILSFYKERGFYKAMGKWDVNEKEDEVFLNYDLIKGAKYKKADIVFVGNKWIDAKLLKEAIVFKGDKLISELYLNAEKIKERMKLVYAKNGYYFAQISEPIYEFVDDKKTAVVKFNIDEKSILTIKEVSFIGIKEFSKDEIIRLTKTRVGSKFLIDDLYKDASVISGFYHSNGYPDAEIKFNYEFDNDFNVLVNFNIEEGSQALIDDIIVKGNNLTSGKLIQKQLIFKKGERVDFKKFSLSEDNLYELGVFRKVKIFNQKGEENNSAHKVYIDVEEIDPLKITYGLRYDNEKNMEFEVELIEQNLFKNAHYASQRYLKNDTQTDVRFTYGIPSFIKTTWRYDTFIFWQKEEFPSFYNQQWGIALQHQFPIRDNMILQYNFNYKKVHTWEKETSGPFPFDIEISVARFISSVIGDYRDNKFNPTHGLFYSMEVELSPRILGSELNFIKLFGQFFYYRQIVNGAVWANSVRLGLANAFDNVLIPSERFFTGGGNSVRGYGLNSLGPISPYTGLPTGGEALFVMNQELRVSIYKMIGAVIFWDCGNIYKKIKDFDPFEVRQSFGFGLRLDTPLGLLRADIGYKINKKAQEKPYEVYISVGHIF